MTRRDELLHAIDALADAGRSHNLTRIEKRHRNARALAILFVRETEPDHDWIDRCWQCDAETPHSRLADDGRCEACTAGDPP